MRVGIRGAACMYICAMAAYRIRLDARHYTQGMYSTYNTHIVETHAYILHSYHIYISIYAAVRAGRVAFCCGWHLRRHCPYLKRHQAALGSLLSRSLRWFGTCCEWDGEDLLLLVRVTWMGYFVRLCSGSRCTTMYRDAVGMYPCMCWGGGVHIVGESRRTGGERGRKPRASEDVRGGWNIPNRNKDSCHDAGILTARRALACLKEAVQLATYMSLSSSFPFPFISLSLFWGMCQRDRALEVAPVASPADVRRSGYFRPCGGLEIDRYLPICASHGRE